MRYEDYAEGELSTQFYLAVAGKGAALPTDLVVSVDSETWLGSETATQIYFTVVVLPPESSSVIFTFSWIFLQF